MPLKPKEPSPGLNKLNQEIELPKFELGRAKQQNHTIWESFGYAFSGLKTIFENERNFRIHLIISLFTVSLSALLEVSVLEWGIVLGFIGLVLFAEITNSAFEYFVDLVTDGRYHPKAKIIKDSMAAAVLICASCAFIAGCFIFTPKLINLIFH